MTIFPVSATISVSDGHSTSEPVSIFTLFEYLAEEDEAYAEQQVGQCITLVYPALIGWLFVQWPSSRLPDLFSKAV